MHPTLVRTKRLSYYEENTIFPTKEREHVLKQFNTILKKEKSISATKGKANSDKEGLERAYKQGDAYSYNNTLYIAGSHTSKDWYDDVTKNPFRGDVTHSTIYQEAEQILKSNSNITNLVGHSLGGSVAL